jgi:phosphoribosylanthranilate isomerase
MKLLKLDKKKSNFVAVLVRPDEAILEKIKHLPFDYYQIYDSTPDEIKEN